MHGSPDIRDFLELVQELPVGEAVSDLASCRHGFICGENSLKPLDVDAQLLPSDHV